MEEGVRAIYLLSGLALLGIGAWTLLSGASIIWTGGILVGLYLLYEGATG